MSTYSHQQYIKGHTIIGEILKLQMQYNVRISVLCSKYTVYIINTRCFVENKDKLSEIISYTPH